jgi:predicted nucleotidyltransferase
MDNVQFNEVIYSDEHWNLLKDKRNQAQFMIKPLHEAHIRSTVYGSIARGDITETSDIDVFIHTVISPTVLVATLESNRIHVSQRLIIQATPSYVAKAYIMIDETHGYSFPLIPMRASESEFPSYAGQLSYEDILEDKRVSGVNKELNLINPTEKGHIESPIQGMEGIVAKKLGVDTRIVQERVRTLERREKVGRTGVYIKRELGPEESFGQVLEELSNSKPGLRRRIRNG